MVEKKLKTAFRGYSKKDVHDYVAELDSEMKAKIALLERATDEAKSEIVNLEGEYARALEGKDNRIEELISAKVASDKVAEQAQSKIEELTRKLNEINDTGIKLRDEISELRTAKAELYEKISALEEERSKIPSALIAAEEKAGIMIEDAKKRADIILSDVGDLTKSKITNAEENYKKIMAESDNFRRKVIISRQNLIAAMTAYKKALDDVLSDRKD
ncbi:MAG: DivIVA domain-containing protein [Bacillota bacterium]|nr:DivIVA domain-containing protein [Bacillota bacterium]